MALTREQLKEMGLPDDQIEEIIKGHTESITGLTNERDRLSNELQTARNDLQTARGEVETARNDLQSYRKQVEADKLSAGKKDALRSALKEAGVQRDDFVDLLARAVDLESVTLEDGKLKDADAIIAPLKASYGGCFAVAATKGTPPVNPPSSSPQQLTREQIEAMSEAEIINNWPAVQAAIGQK